jgi:predicted NAD/FAD-binding protein
MLDHLGVATAPSDMSFAVMSEHLDFEYASTSPNGLYACRRHLLSPSFQRMLIEVRRFQRDAPKLLDAEGDGPSLGHYLEEQRYSPWFVDRLLVPQASAVWSADPREMWSFPAKFLIRFFANHGMLGLRDRPAWSFVRGGSTTYVEAIVAALGDRVALSTPVASIARLEDHVTIVPRGGHAEVYDEVVIAAHADQALAMLADPSDDERRILGAIPYADNEAVLHTDRSLLPRRRHAWASWVYHLLDGVPGKSTVTYHMNRLQAIDCPEQICVTLNRTEAIDPDRIVQTRRWAHPVFTPAGVAAQQEHGTISSVRRTHYCGAYWGWGFHEDGVVSALRACAALGASAPWDDRSAGSDDEVDLVEAA